MIIKIKNHSSFDVSNRAHLLALENLLKGFAEGKHIILAPRMFLSNLSSCEKFGEMTRNQFVEAYRGQMEYQALQEYVNFYVELDFSLQGFFYGWSVIGAKDILSVSSDFFGDSKSVQKVGVICENPNDADFYQIIAIHYSKMISGQIRCPVAFNAINGGGGSTKDIFDRKVEDKDIVLCILDNDKNHPKAPVGGTCKIFKGARHVETGMIKIIDAHEIESLIPLETIRDVVSKNGVNEPQEKAMTFWEELVEYDESVKYYFDHKGGIDLPTVFKLDSKYGEYWLPLIKRNHLSSESECVEREECRCTPPCLQIDGYGSNILPQTVEHVRYGNVHAYSPQLTEHMKSLWLDIGRVFFSWCCAPARRVRL
ncbi:hypothetical protein ACTVP2_07900 [Serratia marcescens]|uniref:hypothetical protein n=1 Tax=Serratia marcescens TaxID=615 RepID=UPI003FA78839